MRKKISSILDSIAREKEKEKGGKDAGGGALAGYVYDQDAGDS